MSFQVVIGRLAKISLDGVAIDVPAKVDTGAFRSAVHATDIKEKTVDGKKMLTCKLLGHPVSPVQRDFSTAEYDKVTVTNSFGHEEERYQVTLKVKVGPKKFNTSFTLADRSNNMFPILIGRKLLKKRFLVDVEKTDVDRKKLREEFNLDIPIDEEDQE